jgi:cell wall-associated NlpC family hydrolase
LQGALPGGAVELLHPDQLPTDLPGNTVGTTTRQKILAAALSRVGLPYVWGGAGPSQFDCSGLVQWSYRQAGLYLPRTAAAQSRVGARVSLSQIRPGDLIFYSYGGGVGHVAMAAGDGMLIESSQSGHPVAKRRIYTRGLAVIRRVALTVHSSTDTP